MKAPSLERLLSQVRSSVDVRCVTRWWPQEIAAGVSDLEIWELFRGQESRKLLLRHDLHAKLYRAGESCLVGSANITGRALGYSTPPNLELLVSVTTQATRAFEGELWPAAVEVDDEMHDAMKALVDSLPAASGGTRLPPRAGGDPGAAGLAAWVPATRHPEDLVVAYRGGGSEQLSRASAEAAASDLATLAVPEGLDEHAFRHAVGVILLQTPVAAAVDRFVTTERRFGEIRMFVAGRTGEQDGTRSWQTLLRWLAHFLPSRYSYRRPHHSELFRRRS